MFFLYSLDSPQVSLTDAVSTEPVQSHSSHLLDLQILIDAWLLHVSTEAD